MKKLTAIVCLAASISATLGPAAASAGYVRPIRFPVDGPATFIDDFSDPRSGGRDHEGIDIKAAKMTPAVSAVDGYVQWYTESEASWGWAVTIQDNEGYTYHYLHLNNDTPGTDDGKGGRQYAIAPGIYRGYPVKKGTLIGWVGDSGNAENTVSHLHFEMRQPGDTAISPYESLLAAERPGRFSPKDAIAASPNINADRSITATAAAGACESDTLIRSASDTAVYYCGADGKRYVFPNLKTYQTWYPDFSGVKTISAEALAAAPLGGNATYRPGVRLVKITTDPKVYAVDRGGVLRHVATDGVAIGLYGSNWAKMVDDVPDAFFVNYKIGDPITSAN